MDEHGTEAARSHRDRRPGGGDPAPATATAIGVRAAAAIRLPPRVTMVADRPFVFAIVDTTTGLPLFLGEFSRPGPA